MISEVWTLCVSRWTLSIGLFLLGRYVTACAFSPTAPLIATGSMDKTVNIWRVEDGSGAQGGFLFKLHYKVTFTVNMGHSCYNLLNSNPLKNVSIKGQLICFF